MSIKLEVEEYCQQCLDFTPVLIKPQRVMLDDGDPFTTDAIVHCQYGKRCSGIVRYLRSATAEKEEAVG